MQYGNEDFLAGLVAEACGEKPLPPPSLSLSLCMCACFTVYCVLAVNALPLNATNFNVDNVRIAKIIVSHSTYILDMLQFILCAPLGGWCAQI